MSRESENSEACTSILCQWKKTTHKVEFARNKDIKYVKPKKHADQGGKTTETEVQIDREKLKRSISSVV